MEKYYLAFAGGDGGFDVVADFEAEDNGAANKWAEEIEDELYADYESREWYVLDSEGNNING